MLSSFLLQQCPVANTQGKFSRVDPWSYWTSPTDHCSSPPMGQGFLRALTRTLGAAVGATNSQNIKKKTRKKESDKCYRKTEQRGSTGVSVGVSLSCSWMCKHLALALLQWPSLSWHQARLGMRKQLQKHEVNRDVPALSCSALTLIDTLASNRIFSSPFQCMSWESWELGIHKQDLNSQRKSSSPQSPIPSGSSLPRWQSSSVNSSLHPGD